MAFIRNFLNMIPTLIYMGPGYAVGIATGYGLDDLWIESGWGRDFPHPSRPALGPHSLLYSGYRVLPGGKASGSVALTTHPHLTPRLKKE